MPHEKREAVPSSSGLVLREPSTKSDARIKDFYDPLNAVKAHLGRKKAVEQQLALPEPERKAVTREKRKEPGPEVATVSPVLTKKSVEDLRQERLRREATARQKTQLLLKARSGVNKDGKTETRSEQAAPREQKYSSQFNPSLARQNLDSDHRRFHQ